MTKAAIYDAGMLIGLVRRSGPAEAQHKAILKYGRPVIPGPVLAQVWRDNPAVRSMLGRYLRDCAVYVDYTEADYKRVGVILGDVRLHTKSRPDVVDALVILTAAKYEQAAVLTGDPGDMKSYVYAIPAANIELVEI